MRGILSEDEIYELIEEMPYEEVNWISNENERKENTYIFRMRDFLKRQSVFYMTSFNMF